MARTGGRPPRTVAGAVRSGLRWVGWALVAYGRMFSPYPFGTEYDDPHQGRPDGRDASGRPAPRDPWKEDPA
ncbi:hypothetical protein ACFOVU_17235 [Nocardiopsis sediminis]|uniref:Uncharacterized protein n=1 Tax=Nocardiopsis sediminis TaxID=1778267 RepID=A0ABV8FSW7_9ACTN